MANKRYTPRYPGSMTTGGCWICFAIIIFLLMAIFSNYIMNVSQKMRFESTYVIVTYFYPDTTAYYIGLLSLILVILLGISYAFVVIKDISPNFIHLILNAAILLINVFLYIERDSGNPRGLEIQFSAGFIAFLSVIFFVLLKAQMNKYQ